MAAFHTTLADTCTDTIKSLYVDYYLSNMWERVAKGEHLTHYALSYDKWKDILRFFFL